MVKLILNSLPRTWLIQLSLVFRPVLAFLYKGTTYTDPISNENFRKFLPYGYAKVRNNVLSPGTLSLERHRLLWLYLQRHTNFFNSTFSGRILHIAPEQAFYTRFKKMQNLTYITSDLHSPLADVKANICSLPFEDNSFDIVFCNHVLEHIPDDFKAMQELFRVMKPNGWAILQVPLDRTLSSTFSDDSITSKEERTRVFGQYDHLRIYGLDYFTRLKEVGFKVEAVPCTKIASQEEILRFCLDENEILPIAYKQQQENNK